jgi:hypothetical protein
MPRSEGDFIAGSVSAVKKGRLLENPVQYYDNRVGL